MNSFVEHLILYSAQQNNILPLTSACNIRCIFCSHPQNPPDIKIYRTGHRSLEDINTTLDFIDPGKKIVIGESVSRIIEGEPFLHPEIRTVLTLIRNRFPETLIQITTNGTLLSTNILNFLQQLGKIELYISLNSSTPRGRELLMGVKDNQACRAVSKLKDLGIPFHGSIVAFPWILGWEDLEKTIKFLDKHRAKTIRVFVPGFTRMAKKELRFDPCFVDELIKWVQKIQAKYQTPLIVEPSFTKNLQARVEGVIGGSLAERAGFEINDEIISINGKLPFSRVEAFELLLQGGQQHIIVKRHGKKIDLAMKKKPGERPGLVFAYDLSPYIYRQVFDTIQRTKSQKPLLMVSTLAEPLIRILIGKLNQEMNGVQVDMVRVKNRFFGGSIASGGLLVIQDFLDVWRGLSNNGYDLILLPDIFLDPWGYDLLGVSLSELEEEIGINYQLIEI